MSWQNEPITEKQAASIARMNQSLGWTEPIPTTKGDAGVIIGKMKAEEKRRAQMPDAPLNVEPLNF